MEVVVGVCLSQGRALLQSRDDTRQTPDPQRLVMGGDLTRRRGVTTWVASSGMISSACWTFTVPLLSDLRSG